MPPEWLFAAEAVLQPTQPDPVILQVHVLEGQHGRLVHAKPVVIDQGEESPVSRGGNSGEEALELVLSEVFGELVHDRKRGGGKGRNRDRGGLRSVSARLPASSIACANRSRSLSHR